MTHKGAILLLVTILLTTGVWADSISHTPLFAKVVGVTKNDTLNVRSKPDYTSKKSGKLPPKAHIGIKKCKTMNKATWCKVYPLIQNWFEEFGAESEGWVNAHYLAFYDRGYVLIDGIGNCDYALQCKENKCEVLISYEIDKEHKITSIKTKWIERSLLKGESNFAAASNDPKINPEGGYCTIGLQIDDYLKASQNKSITK